jgi:hypothetical protein
VPSRACIWTQKRNDDDNGMVARGGCKPTLFSNSRFPCRGRSMHAGSDVTLVAKEAAMRPLRRLMTQLEISTPPAPPKSGNQPDTTATMPQVRACFMVLSAALLLLFP